MDGVHSRSPVTSGATRLHHTAGSTQIAPGGPTNEWQGRRALGHMKGRWLARWSSSSHEGQISPPWAPPSCRRDPLALGSGGWDAVRLANMEVISVLKDENPDSKATSLNLPGDSALGVEGTSGHTFPGLFPPPLSWIPLGHSESRGSPCCTLSGRTSDKLDVGLILIRKHGRSHTSYHVSWRSEEKAYQPSTFLRREKEHIHRNENNKHLKILHGKWTSIILTM